MVDLGISARSKVAYWGVFAALALALSFAESWVAPLLQLPLGVKPGLSNIAVMLAAGVLGLPAGLAVALAKALFAGFTRGLTALLLSGAGGLCSALLVGLLLRRGHRQAQKQTKTGVTATGVGILGGVTHNLAQLALAALLTQTPGVFWLLPQMIVCGVIAGAVTGTLAGRIRILLHQA
ncbi:MAG: Gx transporter family protein [Oscillospiraceae bacterium]|jgi:heptaprenyl diphosphate synthase|nr:Gx transporter family protein [Oscillospiraceae bacterium]